MALLTRGDFEAAALAFRHKVLELALADVLGITAALLDRQGGARTLRDRLHAFCARVEETYQRARGARE